MATRSRRSDPTAQAATHDKLVFHAVAVADAEGLAALTMRRLASEVGLPTMTVYSYFAGKEALFDAMADHVLGGFVTPTSGGVEPLAYVCQLGLAFYDNMLRHPCMVDLLGMRTTSSEASMHAALEQPLEQLQGAGLSPGDAVHVYGVLITHALGFAMYQAARPWAGEDDGAELTEARRQHALLYRSLPMQRFPFVVAAGAELTDLPSRGQFEWGLDALARGFEPLFAADATADRTF